MINFLINETHGLKSRFIYKGVVTIFINNLSLYKQQFNTLKRFEICDSFC